MELSAPPCLPKCSSSLLLKPRVRFFQRTLNPTSPYSKASILSVNPRSLTRMDPPINLSCAAFLRDNNTPPTSALPLDSGQRKTSSFLLFHFPLIKWWLANEFECLDSSFSGARIGEVKRVTKETNVSVKINLDGCGVADSSTGIPFLDHMLDQLASHGLFDVHVKATGDTHIDDHHTNEDVALAIGTALLQALGDRKGINRFGDFSAPLDEALIHVSLDLSGRPHLSYNLDIPTQRVGTYDTQLVEHFFQSLVNTSGMTLHIRQVLRHRSL
ncbi:imidazoleglycerol-phosphate dehydratase [Stylosanthes scabra]|uniref:imidazoleglycerol-phosphate dehydratase n=1 Tax=Stylosanthes scabra TaxID=79078 RepID=A0ABU6WSN3_9FABA|nr:imidazoleglycerol-phosphate dehydratase [Stylosanthes scabra]